MTDQLILPMALGFRETSIAFAGVYEDWNAYKAATRLIAYNESFTGNFWVYDDLPFHTASICKFTPEDENTPPHLVILSSDGHVQHNNSKHDKEIIEVAGLNPDRSAGYGRLTSIRQIGEHLYCCGSGGQIYVRDKVGNWSHLTRELLWDVKNPRANYDKNPNYRFYDMDGSSESDIYIGGERGALFHWNGFELEELDIGETVAITFIHAEKESSVWLCGRNGRLFHGNAEEGFEDYSLEDSEHLFTSITSYRDRIFLASHASPSAVFEFIESEERLVRIDHPEIEFLHTVQAVGDVMWVVGTRDIFRVKGDPSDQTSWERIVHPDIG